MSKVINKGPDSIHVTRFGQGGIELRIGEESFGDKAKGSRRAWLTPREARKVAIALLLEAEQGEDEEILNQALEISRGL